MIELVDHGDAVRFGSSFYWPPALYALGTGDWNSVANSSNLFVHDPVLLDVPRLEFRSAPFDLIGNMGYESTSAPRTSQILGYPPSQVDLPGKLERLNGISQVLKFLSEKPTEPVNVNEHTVAHSNVSGRVHVGSVPIPLPGGPSHSFYRVAQIDTGPPVSLHFNTSLKYQILPGYTFPSEVVEDVIFDMTTKSETLQYESLNGNLYSLARDLVFHLDDDGLRCLTYTLYNCVAPGQTDGITWYLWYKKLRVALGIVFLTGDSTPVTSAWLGGRMGAALMKSVTTVEQYARSYGDQPVWYRNNYQPGSNPLSWDNANSVFPADVWPTTSEPITGWETYSGISGEHGYRKVDTGSTSFLHFRRQVVKISDDLLPLGFLAQGDAYDTTYREISSNLVEFLFELGDIVSLVSSPSDLLGKARDAVAITKVGVPLVKAYLTLVADATLTYSFLYKPSWKLATEVAGKATKLLGIFDQFFGYQDIHGKAVYIVGDELPYFTGCVIVGRSKMRVRVPPDSVLAMLLPLERLHLLPDLTSYWETLRLSFAVDWFFNVQSKLDVIDKTVKFMALETAYVVNSVTLYKNLESTDSFVVDEDTCYKYFCRYVLPTAQVFTPTRLNVLGATGVPSWLTAGSLFYKLT